MLNLAHYISGGEQPRLVYPARRTTPARPPRPSTWARKTLRFKPGPDQISVLDNRSLRVILCCTRRWGKTKIASIAALHHAIFHPHSAVVIVAPNLKQASRHLATMKRFLRGPLKIKFSRFEDHPHTILLPNESTIECLPASDSARSANATFLILDEAAHLPQKIWHIVRPMLATNKGARLWILSTPNGQSGFFHDAFHDERIDYARYRITAAECPRILPDYLAEERLSLTAHRFAQEYNCEFLPAETQLLARQLVEDLLCRPVTPRQLPWNAPATQSVFYLGLDLGKHRDHAALVLLEERTEALGHLDHVSYTYPTDTRLILRDAIPFIGVKTYPEILEKVAKYIDTLPKNTKINLAVDATGVGDGVVDFIHIANLPARIRPIIITSGQSIGHLPHGTTIPKSTLLENLCVNVQSGAFQIENHLPHLPELIKELIQLGDPHYPHSGDLAIALSLALFEARPTPTIGERPHPLPGTPGLR